MSQSERSLRRKVWIVESVMRNLRQLLMIVWIATPTGGFAGEPLRLESGQLYLAFDPRLQPELDRCEWKVHEFRRHPANPVLKPDRKWEGFDPDVSERRGRIMLYGSVLWEPDQQLFKAWYLAGTGLPENQGDQAVCYATSRDGILWDKPALGLHELYGTRENNVTSLGDVIPVVYRDAQAADPARRYVKWSLQTRNGDDGIQADYSIYRFFSPDGLRWTRESRSAVLPGYPNKYLGGLAGDVAMTYWHPRLEKFVCYHKLETPNPNPAPHDQPKNQHILRNFGRFESSDGIGWSEPTWALQRDDDDATIDPYLQIYGLSVHPVGDLYLALTWLYHSNEGDFDIGLAYSHDTKEWRRPFRGQYLLPKSGRGDWDSGMLFTSAHLIEKDGLWWLYYCGCPYPHRTDKRYFAIGLAQTPVGRIASARAWRQEGALTVGPVLLNGKDLFLNAAVLDTLHVEVLDEQNRPIAGYTSHPQRGNDQNMQVRWQNGQDLQPLRDCPVKLRFHLNDAEIFAWTCR